MHKRSITYTDFNGTEVTEDFYFNLSKADIVKMQLSEKVGLREHMQEVVRSNDGPKIVELFEKIVLMSYGERSPDGRYFTKNQEIRDRFASTGAYSDLFVLLATDAAAAAEFINATMPSPKEMDELAATLEAGDGPPAQTPELNPAPPVLVEDQTTTETDWTDYNSAELLAMSQEQFDRLLDRVTGPKPKGLLSIAMQRKGNG
jgi:hypothetical protein